MKKLRIEFLLLGLLVTAIMIVKNISYKSFLNYENTIVTQQKQHLLTIAKSTARSLELYTQEKIKALNNVSNDISILFEEESLSKNGYEKFILNDFRNFYLTQNSEIAELKYIDENKNILLSYPKLELNNDYYFKQTSFTKAFNQCEETLLQYIDNPFEEFDKTFSLYIYQPIITKGKFKGVIIGKIKIETIYQKLVKSIKAGKYGYAMVKNHTGKIIMHPVKEQVGYDVIKTRQEVYPDLDFSELEKLVEKQLRGEEGTYSYYSYWWPQEKLERVKKLNGFAPAFISSDFWIIAVVMSYDEISAPIKKYFYGSLAISILIIIIFAWSIYLIIKVIRSKEAYRIETLYLHELNENAEKLREKDAELHHKRKLETIGTLTGGIAHEFNNILTPIMGYSEMILRRDDIDEEMSEDVQVIYDSSKRSQEIIDQILIYSKDELSIKYEIVLLNKIISDVIKVSASTFLADIKIETNIENKKHYIFANETQIHQVILNLLKNACNAMNKSSNKKLNITLETIVGTNKIPYSKLSIEDSGCGMSKDTLEKIFDPFFTKKLSDKSTGLGLSVALDIIEKHGGKIEVSSQLDIGSRFKIYIPSVDKDLREKKDSEIIKKSNLEGSEKIIIIDNDEFIAKMLKKGLIDLGYKAISFINVHNLLKKFDALQKDGYNIIITDLTMPNMSGIQLSKTVREKNPNIKIILMTAHADEPLDKFKSDKVIDDYILKPVSASQISKCIRSLLKNRI